MLCIYLFFSLLRLFLSCRKLLWSSYGLSTDHFFPIKRISYVQHHICVFVISSIWRQQWMQLIVWILCVVLIWKPCLWPCSCNEVTSSFEVISPFRNEQKCNQCKDSPWTPPSTMKGGQLMPLQLRPFSHLLVEIICFTEFKRKPEIVPPGFSRLGIFSLPE